MSADSGTEIASHLSGSGKVGAPRVTRLTGGVSCETLLVETAPTRLGVKRALDRLLVAGDWTAKVEGAMTETAAIRLVHQLTPNRAPQLLDADPERNSS